jgi:monoamine oxidase
MQCDWAIQQTWDGGQGDAPILTCYVCGRAAHSFVTHEDPVGKALDDLAMLYPEARDQFVDGWIHDWIRDPYAGGGFSNVAPRYVLEHMAHMPAAAGRIHFAGEHTSLWTGFIEGALESAERVAREIGV